ncbi:hypothetical protein L6452_35016 [Arctium lappa]|uniref:Uncharacterized protein n=1 Tax=Arctium lappa TaxID=4217 RepID=A0ACB8YKV0_ARCLA|nr:hypothetical protein L6452_35016 [Arctium lappa]
MVCQSAGQTRFRALKHENGIAGSATIIVKVIACFQPLQDCQAEYFRHLLKPVTIFIHAHDIVHLLVIISIEWRRVLHPGFKTNKLIGSPRIQIRRVLPSVYGTDLTFRLSGIRLMEIPRCLPLRQAKRKNPMDGSTACLGAIRS